MDHRTSYRVGAPAICHAICVAACFPGGHLRLWNAYDAWGRLRLWPYGIWTFWRVLHVAVARGLAGSDRPGYRLSLEEVERETGTAIRLQSDHENPTYRVG